METIYDGIKITVIRKRIKNMYIRIADDYRVVITAPFFVSERTVEQFFSDNIKSVRRAIERKKANSGGNYYDDGYIYVFGVKKTFEKATGRLKIVETEDKITLYTQNDERSCADKAISAFLKEKLSENIEWLISFWETITGLKSSGYSIKLMRTRWGSCNCSTKKLNFSLYLANMPKKCVSYVVLHEICHIRYANHGAGFKAMLSRCMPDWKDVKKFLNYECEKMKFLSDAGQEY